MSNEVESANPNSVPDTDVVEREIIVPSLQSETLGEVVLVPWYEAWYDPDINVRVSEVSADSGSGTRLRVSMAVEGWGRKDPQFRGVGDRGLLSADRINKCMAKRAAHHAELLTAAAKAGEHTSQWRLLKTFEALAFVEGDVAKGLGKPTILGASGNQRHQLYVYAMSDRLCGVGELIPGTEFRIGVDCPSTIETKIPIEVVTFTNELEREAFMVEENTKKKEGYTPMNVDDNLTTAVRMIDHGANQARLRHLYGPSPGQKLFSYIKLAKRFPSLDLIARVLGSIKELKDPVLDAAGRFIRFPWIPGAKLPNLVLQSDDFNDYAALKADNEKELKANKDYKPLEPLDKDGVGAQILQWSRGVADKTPKIMARSEIETITSNTENLIARVIGSAITSRDASTVAQLNVIEPGTNAVYRMIGSPGLANVTQLLVVLETMKANPRFADMTADLLKYANDMAKTAGVVATTAAVAEPIVNTIVAEDTAEQAAVKAIVEDATPEVLPEAEAEPVAAKEPEKRPHGGGRRK